MQNIVEAPVTNCRQLISVTGLKTYPTFFDPDNSSLCLGVGNVYNITLTKRSTHDATQTAFTYIDHFTGPLVSKVIAAISYIIAFEPRIRPFFLGHIVLYTIFDHIYLISHFDTCIYILYYKQSIRNGCSEYEKEAIPCKLMSLVRPNNYLEVSREVHCTGVKDYESERRIFSYSHEDIDI